MVLEAGCQVEKHPLRVRERFYLFLGDLYREKKSFPLSCDGNVNLASPDYNLKSRSGGYIAYIGYWVEFNPVGGRGCGFGGRVPGLKTSTARAGPVLFVSWGSISREKIIPVIVR